MNVILKKKRMDNQFVCCDESCWDPDCENCDKNCIPAMVLVDWWNMEKERNELEIKEKISTISQ